MILAALGKEEQEEFMKMVLPRLLADKSPTVKVKALEVIVPCLCTL